MNVVLLKTGEVFIQLLLLALFQLTTINCQLNLYDTDRMDGDNSLQYDCLNYYMSREKLAYQHLSDVSIEIIPFCVRPTNNLDKTFESSVNPLSQRLTFQDISLGAITSQQLLSWSISIEVVQRYQLYLKEPNSALNEYFYNCTEPWFGLRCQYSFEYSRDMSFNPIIEATFHQRLPYSDLSDLLARIPCYILMECHRQGQFWCLDWREICDGAVDCFDEGLDEEHCFDMEINECNDNEYRCHNGLCIADELWEAGEGDADCLDRSDEILDASYVKSCFHDPTFRCEEHTCRPGGKSFSCADGECVQKFEYCRSGRHVLLIESATTKGNLTDHCWIAMVCLTELVKQINGKLCETWMMNNSSYEFLEQCDTFFQFPAIPVHSNHVRYFYENVDERANLNELFVPDYVCYNPQLCSFTQNTPHHENLPCLSNFTSAFERSDTLENPWILMMFRIEHRFRSCMVTNITSQNKAKYNVNSSLHKCNNSMKFISKHRIWDRMTDCIEGDDETLSNSCSLQHRHRVKCGHANKCWSPLLKTEACWLGGEQSVEEIPFRSFFNGIENHFYHSYDEQRRTEEDNCPTDWLCDNLYSRCDGYWACSDGRDEYNCSQTRCPRHTLACVSPINYTVICLPFTSVNDESIDCLGAFDEQHDCRSRYSSTEVSFVFRCSAGYHECLSSSQLCDKKVDCLVNHDDEVFCKDQQFTCNKSSMHNRSEIEEILCGLSENANRNFKYFSLSTSSNYPSGEKDHVDETIHWLTERDPLMNIPASAVKLNLSSYSCHRGRVVETWIENNSYKKTCLCPPSYYGHLCQYQNQRISLTLRVSSNDRHGIYDIVSMLIDDDNDDDQQEIYAFNQFTYIADESCTMKLSQYLLFPTRPKDISKNYSIRIDIFDKTHLAYVGSWHLIIPFLFLPVNRIAVSFNLSNNLIETVSECPIQCYDGSECIKYLNKEKYFCRCPSHWSGIYCNIPSNCHACSSDSLCIGSTNNRAICVCPSNKFGPQCLLKSTCPINACQNNGQCIPRDMNIAGSNYTCICPNRYFGQYCQYQKLKLDVALNNINISSYLVAYFFTISNKSEPIQTIILRKLTLFQHTVTFHVSVPYHLVFIRTDDKFYLAALQQSPRMEISTSISPSEECLSVNQLLNSTILKMVSYERIIYFHDLCHTHWNLTCFIDEIYLCLCTNDHHANCIKFPYEYNFQCLNHDYCKNGGQCLQDHPSCPSTKICICPSCFFGDQCQFYAKALGSTLDEILGYEFRRNQNLFQQPITVQMSAAIVMLIIIMGLINAILSIMTFTNENCHEVGSGTYLLASSITSLLTMILFTLKFWLLLLSYAGMFNTTFILTLNCRGIEPLLKLFLYLDNWLNACVAVERSCLAFAGVIFKKPTSKRVAKYLVLVLVIYNCGLLIPQWIKLHVYEDKIEERSWCVITHTSALKKYTQIIIFVNYIVPISINICSAISIIIITALQRTATQGHKNFWEHFTKKLQQYKALLISPTIIIILTLPHLITSMVLDCNKSSRLFPFYLSGYFLSFLPAASVFIIFVLPSPVYKQEFEKLILRIRRRFRTLT